MEERRHIFTVSARVQFFSVQRQLQPEIFPKAAIALLCFEIENDIRKIAMAAHPGDGRVANHPLIDAHLNAIVPRYKAGIFWRGPQPSIGFRDDPHFIVDQRPAVFGSFKARTGRNRQASQKQANSQSSRHRTTTISETQGLSGHVIRALT